MKSLITSPHFVCFIRHSSIRIKKKLEGDINELEIALDHANKANSEAQKSIKRYQVT